MNINGPNGFLKLGLLGNASFSLLTGIILLAATAPLANWIGINDSLALTIIGVLLVPFAAHLWIAARRREVHTIEIVYFCVMDALWVAGSVVLLATGIIPFTAAGNWTVALVALVVIDFFLLQIIGLIRSRKPITIS